MIASSPKFLALISALILFGGCDIDNVQNEPIVQSSSASTQYFGAKVVSCRSELPKCNTKRVGQLFYVEDGAEPELLG